MQKFLILTVICVCIQGMHSFTTPHHISTTKSTATRNSSPFISDKTTSTTALSEGRQWNFNEGRGPYGFKKNAEIWNGRVAQVNINESYHTIFSSV